MVAITTGFYLTWFQRNTRIYDPARGSDSSLLARHHSVMQGRLRTDRGSYRFTCNGPKLLAAQALVDAVLQQVTPTCVVPDGIPHARWSVLSFDGESRGNRGMCRLGRSRLDRHQMGPTRFSPRPHHHEQHRQIHWSAQRSPAPAANRLSRLYHHWRQPACHLSPTTTQGPQSQTSPRRARLVAGLLHIQEWRHHLRAHNAMADALANFAMDTHSTATLWPTRLQPSIAARRQLLTMLQSYCTTDLQP
jgi:hypothetical protein